MSKEAYKNLENHLSIIAGKILNEEIRKKSSSGGLFYLLGREILTRGGVVFGASWDGSSRVCHKCITSIEKLFEICGSKYVHSEMGDCLKQVRNNLEKGRPVLFSGTPCQIAALRKTLKNRDDPNLYTQDCFCHGVPPAVVWRNWLSCLETKHESHVMKVQFRCKESGWHNYSVRYDFDNGDVIKVPFYQDIYMRLFLANVSLMSACYRCHFRGLERASDITLGDFWGVENFFPEIDDEKGISLCIIHSEKGKELINSILSDISYVTVSQEQAVACNPSAIKNANVHPKHDYFFKRLGIISFDVLAENCLHRSMKDRIVSRIKKILHIIS